MKLFAWVTIFLLPWLSAAEDIDGGWTDWDDAGICCRGIQNVSRSCTNPPPSGNGAFCPGPSLFTQTCEPDDCVHGGWSDWQDASLCCNGRKTVTRTCTNPEPALRGDDCAGPSSFSFTCEPDDDACDPIVDGGWSEWQDASICCNGIKNVTRTCTNPPPSGNGADCVGPSRLTQTCSPDDDTCVPNVDGGWSEWQDASICCNGIKNVTRTCTNPPPSGNGANCAGPNRLTQTCTPDDDTCVPNVDGGWSEWQDASICCNGIKNVTRTCTNPPPSGNGANCAGPTTFTQTCAPDECVPAWGDWSDWEPCCYRKQTRSRECIDPANQGRKTCLGVEQEERACPASQDICQPAGVWSEWSEFGPCCFGEQTRTRNCIGDNDCEGEASETVNCERSSACFTPASAQCVVVSAQDRITTENNVYELETECCQVHFEDTYYDCLGLEPVDGGWSRWSAYTSCCNGTQTRTRECNNPEPANGGQPCVGSNRETEFCSPDVCSDERVAVVDGGWGEWEAVGGCCFGVQSFYRVCNNPQPSGGGLRCEGDFREERACTPVDTCESEDDESPDDRSTGSSGGVRERIGWWSFLVLVSLTLYQSGY